MQFGLLVSCYFSYFFNVANLAKFHYLSLSFTIFWLSFAIFWLSFAIPLLSFGYLSLSSLFFAIFRLSLVIRLLSFGYLCYPIAIFWLTFANLADLILAIFVNLANLAIPCYLPLPFTILFTIFSLSLAIFCYPKIRKYFIETKIFIKISIVFKNLFQSVREKN